MPALREIFASFGIEFDRANELGRGAQRTESLGRRLRQFGALVGGGLIVNGIRRMVGDTIRMADTLEETAQQVGMTTREFQAYAHAAGMAGVDTGAFSMAIGQLSARASAATRDGGETAAMLRRLGLSVVDASGNVVGGGELLRRVADRISGIRNPTERTAAAMELMGRAGRRMVPMLLGGRAGLAGLEAELDRLGGGVSDEFIEQSSRIEDGLSRWRMSFLSLRSTIILSVLPALQRGIDSVTRITASISRSPQIVTALTVAFGLLGAAATAAAASSAAAWLAAGWPLIIAAAAVLALYFAADELYVTWKGGNSILRESIDTIFPGLVDGLSATERAILFVSTGLADMLTLLGDIGAMVAPLGDLMVSVFRGPMALVGIMSDLVGGMGAGRALSRFAGRMTADLTGLSSSGALLGENPEAADQRHRREQARLGSREFGHILGGGELTRNQIAARGVLVPERLRARAGASRSVTVEAPTDVTINIHDAGILSPREAADLAKQEVRAELGRQTRQIASTLGGTDWTEWEDI